MPVEARAYPRPLPNAAWLGKLSEEILDPDLPIVDPHHHLWDHPGSRYLLDELLADVNSGHNIIKTVFIQCASGYRTSGPEEMRPIGESEFVRAIAEEGDRRGGKTKICAGIVSFADLRLPNVDAVLEGQIAAAGGRFRGIRQIAAHDPSIIGASSYVPPPGLMEDPNFRRGLKRLPAHNLTFEAWIYHPQIKTLTEVARECPEVKIVLNHFGGPLGVGPYKRNAVFPQWRANIKALSACPNVYVKLGGLALIVNAFDFHLAPLPPSSGEMANAWRPYVETCIENFGANRCMFESNFPVDKGACSYPVLFNAFKRLAQGAPASEKADLFAGTASRFYRARELTQGNEVMSDLPAHVEIHEEGPREGFQIEPGPISTADKIKLIEALAETGLHHIQAASFVSPRIVPGWADAEDVVSGFTPKEGVHYTGLWFNANGLNRALVFRNKLTITGAISLTASEAFTQKNLHRSHAENVEAMKKQTALHLENNVEVPRIGVMAAFGCNYQGDIAPSQVISTLKDGLAIAEEAGAEIKYFSLADTMGWATPMRVERVLGDVRSRWPEMAISLHLHDTRGLAVANAHAGLKMGVTQFDTTVGGLGGCPFAGQPKAAGNICTEELVLLCEEMGIDTGVDLDALIEVGRMAEEIVGHQLPSELIHAGSLDAFRRRAAA